MATLEMLRGRESTLGCVDGFLDRLGKTIS